MTGPTVVMVACALLASCGGAAPSVSREPALATVIRLEPYFRDLRVVRAVGGRDAV